VTLGKKFSLILLIFGKNREIKFPRNFDLTRFFGNFDKNSKENYTTNPRNHILAKMTLLI